MLRCFTQQVPLKVRPDSHLNTFIFYRQGGVYPRRFRTLPPSLEVAAASSAAHAGFEPAYPEPKTGVLPLNEWAISNVTSLV